MPRITAPCLVATFLVSLAFLVPGCSKSKGDLILGTWKPSMGNAMMQMVFNQDGTCTLGAYNGKYRIDGNNLVVTSPDVLSGNPVDNTFTIVMLDNKNLSIQDKDGRQDFVRVQ